MKSSECQGTANLLLPSGQQVGLFILNEFSSACLMRLFLIP